MRGELWEILAFGGVCDENLFADRDGSVTFTFLPFVAFVLRLGH